MRKFIVHKNGKPLDITFQDSPLDYRNQVFDRFDDWAEKLGFTYALPYHEFAGGMGWTNENNDKMYLVEIK